MTTRQWREDLHDLLRHVKEMHRHPFHTVSADAFERQGRLLHDRIPHLAAHEIVVAFARLFAMIGDGHTVLRLQDVPGFGRYPIEISRYSDGLFVQAVAIDAAEALGARLLAIDDVAVDDAWAALRPFISRDNEMGIVNTAPRYVTMPEVLHAAGVTRQVDRAAFHLGMQDGRSQTIELTSTSGAARSLVSLADRNGGPVPHHGQLDGTNWFAMAPGTRSMYVAFDAVRDGADESAAAFFDRLFSAIDADGADRLILDLRRNSGGNNLLNQPLIHHLIRCAAIHRWGGLYCLIGRVTFSAAMNLAVDLERHTRVIFVGEPTGSSPNHYGENGEVMLPHSGLQASVSTLWWQVSLPFDDRPWIAPDIAAPLSSSQAIRNEDPALQAALSHDASTMPHLAYPDRIFDRRHRTPPRHHS